MSWLQFVASIAQSIVSLAWPASFVVVFWMFREKLIELLPLLRAKYKDVEISFKLEQAEREAAALPPSEKSSEPTPEEQSRFDQLASISPRAAIQETRRELEYAVSNIAVRHGLITKPTTLLIATRDLRNKGIIGPQLSALLDDLRNLGNKAAHGGPDAVFTKEEADRFRALATRAMSDLTNEAGD
ncbi:MAG TPA: DUF4145 domain-containing protein [Xanthobacteraceae bacterium]